MSAARHDGPLRLGILGCANIAKQFVRDVAPSPKLAIAAVASRSESNATAFAAAQRIPRAHGSYEALLADPAIDAVYVPLPNSMHAQWTIAALEHGKHVLCEKPLALDFAEAQAMFDAAQRNQRILLEGYPWRFQPHALALDALLAAGAIGQVRYVQACFGFTLQNAQTNIRMKPELGGGALLDAGSYALSVIRLAMGGAPQRVQAEATLGDTGVDIATMATLDFGDGRRAQLSCAIDAANHRRATIVGTKGTIETEYINHTSAQHGGDAFGYLTNQLRVRRGIANSVPFEELAPAATGSGFLFAAEAFAHMVGTQDHAAMARHAAESLDIAASLEAIAQSARRGQRVDVVQAKR